MKNKIQFVILFSLFFTLTINAQKKPGLGTLQSDIALAFTGYDGTNSCSVTWNPEKQLYYAVFAGNGDYPLETFDSRGMQVHGGIIGADTRGIWYNPKTKQIEGVDFDGGYFKTVLDDAGHPVNSVEVKAEAVPGALQSIWQFNPTTGGIYLYAEGNIMGYSKKKFILKDVIKIGSLPCSLDEINHTTVVYTGHKNYEFGFLDFVNYKVHLINTKGEFTASLDLPDDAILNEAFCFAFANDRIWLYSLDERVWKGYPAFF